MNRIEYLCHDCCDRFNIKSNAMGVNDAGRKNCYSCGDSDDRKLHVDSDETLDLIINKYNSERLDEIRDFDIETL